MSRAWPGVRRAVAVVVALLLGAGLAPQLRETPLLLLGAALLPATLAAILAAGLTRAGGAAWRLRSVAFLWGAVVTPDVASAASQSLHARLAAAVASLATALSAVIGAPIIEETVQAVGLALLLGCWRDAGRGARAGAAAGAAMGLGFSVAENLRYFALAALSGGAAGLGQSVYLRAVLGSPIHAVFTAAAGAGIGAAYAAAARGRRGALVAAGVAAAIAQHALWNGLGAVWLDTVACAPRALVRCGLGAQLGYWLVTAPLIVALFLGPGLVGLLWISRASSPPRGEAGEHGCRSSASRP